MPTGDSSHAGSYHVQYSDDKFVAFKNHFPAQEAIFLLQLRMRPTLQPRSLHAFEALGEASSVFKEKSRIVEVKLSQRHDPPRGPLQESCPGFEIQRIKKYKIWHYDIRYGKIRYRGFVWLCSEIASAQFPVRIVCVLPHCSTRCSRSNWNWVRSSSGLQSGGTRTQWKKPSGAANNMIPDFKPISIQTHDRLKMYKTNITY